MTINNIVTSCFTMLFAIVFSHGIAAETVYKWTDDEGNIHFSDVPPVDTGQSGTEEINIFIGEDEYGDPDQYSIINQADRMAERRRQESKDRLAKKRLYLEEKRLELAQAQITRDAYIDEQEVYRPVYGLYPGPVYGHYQGPVYGYHPYNNRDFKRFRKSGQGLESGHGFHEPVSEISFHKRMISGPGDSTFKKFGSTAVIKF